MLSIFRKLSLAGVRRYAHPEMKRRVVLINQFSIISALFCLVGVAEYFFLEHLIIIPFMAGLFIIYSGSLFLSSIGLAVFGVLLQNICESAVILFVNLTYDVGGLGFLYYFPMVMAQVFLLNSENTRRKMYLNFCVTAASAIASVLCLNNGIHIDYPVSGEMIREMASFNTLGSSLLTAILLMLYVDFNRRSEKRLEKIIRDRELLLAEVHHRVKNNLAIISGLLNLQKNTVTDENTRQVLEDSRSRVASMALIHDRLYRNRNFSSIDFDNYVVQLLDDIDRTYGGKNSVTRELELNRTSFDIKTSIPCGLILNELMTNSYKHAFRNRDGKIQVRIIQKDGHVSFYYGDNGPGVQNVDKILESESLGITIITSLAEQLDARYNFYNDNGLKFKMDFDLVK